MLRSVLFSVLLLSAYAVLAQNKTRKVEELINKNEPGWPMVQQMIDSAKNKVEILPADSIKARDAIFKTQVTTRSPMGAIIYKTGGLLIDSGWIRVLGSGHPRLNRSLPEWNKGKSFKEYGEAPGYLLVADDILGGFFAVNGGTFSKEMGKVYYLSPDNLEWENLDITYTEFLNFCFNGNLNDFYKGFRWDGWQKEVMALPGDKMFSFFPFLWSIDRKDINKSTKLPIPADEQYRFSLDTRKQLGLETNYHK